MYYVRKIFRKINISYPMLPFFFKRRYVTSFHFLKNDFINQNVFLLVSADT